MSTQPIPSPEAVSATSAAPELTPAAAPQALAAQSAAQSAKGQPKAVKPKAKAKKPVTKPSATKPATVKPSAAQPTASQRATAKPTLSSAKPTAKPAPVAAPKPAPKKAAQAPATQRPLKAMPPVAPLLAAPEKDSGKTRQKLVRDSFTMPPQDFNLIADLKARALGFGRPTKKSELLRAGLQVLNAMKPAALQQVLSQLAPLKTGRPKKHG